MIDNQILEKLERCFVLVVALEEGKFDYYVTEPKIFYDNYREAEQIQNALIDKKELTPLQIKIQSIWKVKL
jgi:hypothetical protein